MKRIAVLVEIDYGSEVVSYERRGLLIDDNHAAYVEGDSIRMVAVKPTGIPNLYAEEGAFLPIGRIEREEDTDTVIDGIIGKLRGMNGYEFFTRYILTNREIDAEFDLITEDAL